MDKNTIIGFVLIALVIIGFSYLNKPSAEELAKQKEQRLRDSIEYIQTLAADTKGLDLRTDSIINEAQKREQTDSFFASTLTDSSKIRSTEQQPETFFTLQNLKLSVVISNKGGSVVKTQLKEYKRFDGDSLYLSNHDSEFSLLLTNKQGKVLRTSDLAFTSVPVDDDTSLIMRYVYTNDQYIDFIYKLAEDDYMLKFDIRMVGLQPMLDRDKADIFEMHWNQKIRKQEKSEKNEQRYSHLAYKYVGGDMKELSGDKNDAVEVKEPAKWIAYKDQFFASILIADQPIETALLNSKILPEATGYLKSCISEIYVPAKSDKDGKELSAGFAFYYGPLVYSHLKHYDDNIKDPEQRLNLDKLVPLGWGFLRWINQYFVIPIFDFLSGTGMSMGIVIFLLTLIVKIVIAPLTYKSFMSSAKMKVLRPQVEEINAKYPKQEQAMEKQQATMAMYSQAGVNPMSGCVPMLLQMPILIALFSFFPNAIELRQQSFLWAKDLSTYDAIFEWKTSIPLIGNHISLFCILMTITNIIYTKFNMDMTNSGQQQMPGMKWMMYLMPLIFLFMLNDFPSGLTYYYFISLLMTILLTLAFRFFVDENKVLAKLEANKAKPKKKKSGFMARLEEAQRIQQQQLKEKNKVNSTKKKR